MKNFLKSISEQSLKICEAKNRVKENLSIKRHHNSRKSYYLKIPEKKLKFL
jgi:hypothetical protein